MAVRNVVLADYWLTLFRDAKPTWLRARRGNNNNKKKNNKKKNTSKMNSNMNSNNMNINNNRG